MEKFTQHTDNMSQKIYATGNMEGIKYHIITM